MKKKHYYYIDMDGVLADFDGQPNAVGRFRNEKGFFEMLEPISENVEAVARMIENHESVRILSKSPNPRADKDKIKWLKKYLPQIKQQNIILIRNYQRKQDYMATKQGILFDDYGQNCREWETVEGNVAVKITSDVNIAVALSIVA